MKTKKDINKPLIRGHDRTQRSTDGDKENLSGYPEYPDNEDIYIQYREESDINPEEPTKMKDSIDNAEPNGETDMNDFSGSDLDIPGSELDDDQESIGSEDEENNYYSLGEGDPDSLPEDKEQ